MTDSIVATLEETDRRREKQIAHNLAHGITPQSIRKSVHQILDVMHEGDDDVSLIAAEDASPYGQAQPTLSPAEIPGRIDELRKQMRAAAAALEFEAAARLRDEISRLQRLLLLHPDGADEGLSVQVPRYRAIEVENEKAVSSSRGIPRRGKKAQK
jgi:excinuclease ABC subunit B